MNTVIIRKALVNIAEKNGRPHYPMCVVSEVIKSFINGTEHFLKKQVESEASRIFVDFDKCEPEIKTVKEQSEWFKKRLIEQESLIDDLVKFCEPKNMRKLLSYYLDISASQIYFILQKQRLFTDEQLGILESAKEKALKDYKLYYANKAG